jgi:hypothetical protein
MIYTGATVRFSSAHALAASFVGKEFRNRIRVPSSVVEVVIIFHLLNWKIQFLKSVVFVKKVFLNEDSKLVNIYASQS